MIRLGGDPEKSGSVAGSLHRGWLNLKSALTGKDDHAVCRRERGEDGAVKNYKDALAKNNLPGDLRTIIQRQFAQVQAAHDQVGSLRDASEMNKETVGSMRNR